MAYDSEGAQQFGIKSKSKSTQYLAAYLATLSAVSIGTSIAWSSAAIPLLSHQGILHGVQNEWVGSLVNVGGFIGALPAGYIVNNLGRKRTLILINIVQIMSWALVSISLLSTRTTWVVTGLYIAKLLTGLAAGATSVAASMYISEIAESSVRGRLGTFYQLQVSVGLLYAYVVGLVESVLVISLLCGIIPFIFIGTFVFMPESPVYLISRNQYKEASKGLQWFRGPDSDIQGELKHIQIMLNESKQNEASVMDKISDFTSIKAIFIVLGIMVFQQFCGVNAIESYTTPIFHSAGSTLNPKYESIIIGCVQVVATYISSLLIEKVGRRILLILSDVVMGICLALLGTYFYFQAHKADLSSWNWLPLASLAVYIVAFSLGYGPIPWIIMGELVPPDLKGMSSALGSCISWLLAFVVTSNFPDAVIKFGESNTFWGFAIISIIGAIFVAALLPETKGKDIQCILEELGKKPLNIKLEPAKI